VDAPPFEALATGWNHTCALTSSGSVFCWGLNRHGQVGDGSRLDRLSPRQVMTGASALAAGDAHTCAVVGRGVRCWGDNGSGQIGDGTNEPRAEPTSVVDLPGVPMALVAGAAHTCVLLGDGAVHCWGQNRHGQLGNGSTGDSPRPTPVVGGIVFERISAGGAVTCGVTARGVEYCWGLNQSGQLGDGTLTNRAAPTRARG
jgi:alpha-tubulin suppressor-like RCC1 family protein